MTYRMRILLAVACMMAPMTDAMAQQTKCKEMHKVKRKETLFGIAKDNGITIEQLIDANPEMQKQGYELKKGAYICIPYPKQQTKATITETKQQPAEKDVTQREIRMGVMLPLHDINGDGKRMVEYYRGLLMACDSIKQEGVSVDVRAWNVEEGADIKSFIKDPAAAKLDVIVGPLYSTQVKDLSAFAKKHDIKLFIPFSINVPEGGYNENVFQVYQNHTNFNAKVIDMFVENFSSCHVVIVDCNDTTSKKGVFTFPLRKKLEEKGISQSVTNLKSSELYFAKAFDRNKRNVVVLNTGRSPELTATIAKLNNMKMNNPGIVVSLFGYTDWLLYTKHNLDNFFKYDTYIPATFYMNPLSAKTKRINTKYRWNFHADMMQALPRFAITGFDHGYFLLKGLHIYGKKFTGAAGTVGYAPIQTRLAFEPGEGGAHLNHNLTIVHYKTDNSIETINK